MNRNIAVSAVAMTALFLMAPSAFAATQAGTKVHNSASVTYKVSGVVQTAPPAGTADFLVDRKVDFTVTEIGGTTTTATPGADSGASVVTRFQVVNNTNDLLDIKLAATNLGQPAVFDAVTAGDGEDTISSNQTGTMTFTLYRDDLAGGGNGDGLPDAGELLPTDGSQYIDGMTGGGATATILVVADAIPEIGDDLGGSADVADGDILAVKLTGTAAAAYAAPDGTGLTFAGANNDEPQWTADTGNLGTDLANTTSDTSTKVDNVLAESEDTDFSPAGTEHDGIDAAVDAYELGGAAIVVTKRSAVYWDPINQFTNPKAIPGSVVLYCITVSNSGSAAASDVAVNDIVPTNTAFEEGATDIDDVTSGVQSLTDGTTTLDDTNSLRFSAVDSCTAGNWDTAGLTASTKEDSDSGAVDSADTDADGIPNDDEVDTADGNYGDYNSGTSAIKTIVSSLAVGSTTTQYTTAMFLVKVN
jgi:uncharacterized repeat protein (TIGR01451 family)